MNFKDDFYSTVNYDWITNKYLENTQTHVDNFSELTNIVDNYLYTEINNWTEKNVPEGYGLENFVIFYKNALNYKKRETEGLTPLLKVLTQYTSLNSFDDYVSKISDLELKGLPNLIPFRVAPDLFNSQQNMIWLDIPELIFPDSSYYDEDNELGKNLLVTWYDCQKEVLKEAGFTAKNSEKILDKVIELDKVIIKNNYNTPKQYYICDFTELQQLLPNLPLKHFFECLIGETPKKYIVSNIDFWKKFGGTFFSETMWDYLKARLIYGTVIRYSFCLTRKMEQLSSKFRNIATGINNTKSPKQQAYELTQFALGYDLSYWYSNKILSTEDIEIVKKLTDTIINSFKKEIKKSSNLTEYSKKRIINKLKNIFIQIGGPNRIVNENLTLSLEESLVDNINTISANSSRKRWQSWNKKIEKSNWITPSFTVDAYYHSQLNKITLPAGILQKPFYSKEYSVVENLSKIGFLIAHEIAHAFDIDGCFFDENGNYGEWIASSDQSYFNNIANKVKVKYHNQKIENTTINGELTLSENLADLIGFNCIENIISDNFTDQLDDFYKNFARLWRIVERTEHLEMMVLTDTHSPSKLRVNNLLSNSKTFLDLYQISEKDKMWINPNEQIIIW